MSKPIVPEVSLIFEESKKSVINQATQPKSYKEWKQCQQRQQQTTKFAPNQTSTVDRKKIVTFNLPNDNQPAKDMQLPSMESIPMPVCQQLDLSLCVPRKSNQIGHHTNQTSDTDYARYARQDYNDFLQHQNNKRMMASAKSNATESFKSFPNEMFNQIPDPLKSNQNHAPTNGITLNDVYQLLQNMQQLQTNTANDENNLNQLNRQNIGSENYRHIDQRSYVPGSVQVFQNPPSINSINSNNNEPTMKDMFNVVLKQQEQLMNIQNQVHVLLMRSANATPNQLETKHHNNKQIMGDSNANMNQIESHTKQVGVMTSLEINVQNIKPSATQIDEHFSTPKRRNRIENNQNMKQCGCVCSCESQKQLQSSDSGSNDDNVETSPRQGDSQTGWTFYGNILNQVNDVLQSTSPISSAKGNEHQSPQLGMHVENRFNSPNEALIRRHSNVMPNIRSAQFKQVGFQIDDVNISAMTKR